MWKVVDGDLALVTFMKYGKNKFFTVLSSLFIILYKWNKKYQLYHLFMIKFTIFSPPVAEGSISKTKSF